VRAAQDALAGLAALDKSRIEQGKPPLDIGIGINVGQVSYGNIGSPGRLDFTVLGGAVNVASRIEGLTKSLGHRVLTTTAVAEAAPELFPNAVSIVFAALRAQSSCSILSSKVGHSTS
jgi:adenylate cyclase